MSKAIPYPCGRVRLTARVAMAAWVLGFVLAMPMLSADVAGGSQAPGGLTAVGGPGGCLLVSPGSTGCEALVDVGGPLKIRLSPDGRFVYVLGAGSHSIAILVRDAQTGTLSAAGCVADAQSPFASRCAPARALRSPVDLAIADRTYVAARGSDAVVVFDRDSATGMLRQLDGAAGCSQQTGAEGCAASAVLRGPVALATAANVLVVASAGNDSVAGFEVGGGQLFHPPWDYSCVMEQGGPGTGCLDGRGLVGLSGVVLSGDDVYVSALGSDAIARFTRSGGGPSFKEQAPGPAGCVSAGGVPDCAALDGLLDPGGLQLVGPQIYVTARSDGDPALGVVSALDVAADGSLSRRAGRCIAARGAFGCVPGMWSAHPVDAATSEEHLYVAGSEGSVTAYQRASDGSLSALSGPAACVAASPPDGCSVAPGLGDPRDLEASPDGRFLYVATADGVVVLRRDTAAPSCSNGSGRVPAATTVTLTLTCSDANGDPVRIEILRAWPGGTLGAVDQTKRTVSFTPAPGFTGGTAFTFRPVTHGATGATATYTLAVDPPPRIGSRVNVRFTLRGRLTRVQRMVVSDVPAGARVEVRCRTRGRGCPFTRKLAKSAGGRADLTRILKTRGLAAGAVIEVRVTQPGFIGRVVRYAIRTGRRPKRSVLCLPAGASTPRAC